MMKHTWKFTLWTGTMVLLALPALTAAVDDTDTRTRITDPQQLERLGFEPGTVNVFVTPEVSAQLRQGSGAPASESILEAEAEASSDNEQNTPQGGNDIGVTTIHASDFSPTAVNASTDYQVGSTGGNPGEQLWCNAGNTMYIGVFRDIPTGATLRFRRVWFYDDHDVQDIHYWLQRTCLPSGGGEPETTILRMGNSSGTPEYGRLGPGNSIGDEVDAAACVYTMRVRLGNGGACAAGGDLRLLKAHITWNAPAGDGVFADRFEQQ